MSLAFHLLQVPASSRYATLHDGESRDGRVVDVLNHPEPEMFGWVSVEEVAHVMMSVRKKGVMADVMAGLMPSHLFLSQRAKGVLDGLRTSGHVSFLPSSVVTPDGRALCEGYFVFPLQRVEAIDFDRSDIEYINKETKSIARIRKYAFHPDRVPPVDLFYIKQSQWIATAELAVRFAGAGLTGCQVPRI